MDARLAGLGVAAFLFGIGSLGGPVSPTPTALDRTQGGQPLRWSFDLDLKGSLPPGATAFSGAWGVRPHADAPSGRNALCQLAMIPSAALSLGDVSFADVVLTARLKPFAGHGDQVAGLLLRIQDPDRFYVLHAHALEGRVSIDRHDGGQRITLKDAMAQVQAGHWQELRVEAVGSHFRGFLNGQPVVEVVDDAYRAGEVGLWTSADSATCFDDVTARSP